MHISLKYLYASILKNYLVYIIRYMFVYYFTYLYSYVVIFKL